MDQDRTENLTMEERLAASLAQYQAAGRIPDAKTLLGMFPELAEQIRAYVGGPRTELLDHPSQNAPQAHSTVTLASSDLESDADSGADSGADGSATRAERSEDATWQFFPTDDKATQQGTLDDDSPPDQGACALADSQAAPTVAPTGPEAAATRDYNAGGAAIRQPLAREFGDYELLEEIAQGGMGVVFKALQKSIRRVVALKMILAGQLATTNQIRRFRTEAEEAGSLDHPNIVPIYQVGERQGQHYFTMKLIEGGPLSAQVKNFVTQPRAAARLVAEVARAVHYAHQRGILHRDLKPGNILLDAGGQPHVTDFGLAKHMGGPEAATQSGAIMGTPSYMAPEQACGRKDLSTAVDIYSLGAVLYELLTGRPPFLGDNTMSTLSQVLERDPVPPSTLQRKLDRALETVCLKCLRKEPDRRYATAEALAEDLERWLAGEPIQARPASTSERFRKWVRRHPALAALMLVSTLALLALCFGAWWYNIRLSEALLDARTNALDSQRNALDSQRHALESERQKELATNNFEKRLQVVDDMLVRMDARLANLSGSSQVRLEFLHEALRLSKSILADKPDDANAHRQTARVYRTIGAVGEKGGHLDSSDHAFTNALEIYRKLNKDFPQDQQYADLIAQTLAQHAHLQRLNRQLVNARDSYKEAIEIQERLLAAVVAPDFEARARGARYRFELGRTYEDGGKIEDAAAYYRASLEHMERLAADNPRRVDVHTAVVNYAMALALVERSPAAAETLLQRAVAGARTAHTCVPSENAELDRILDASYSELAAYLVHHGRHEELERMALAYREDFMEPGGRTYNVACFLGNAAAAVDKLTSLSKADRSDVSQAYGDKAVDWLAKAIKEGYTQRVHIELDPDMDPLRERPDFQEVLADLERRFPMSAAAPGRAWDRIQKCREASGHSSPYRAAEALPQKNRRQHL